MRTSSLVPVGGGTVTTFNADDEICICLFTPLLSFMLATFFCVRAFGLPPSASAQYVPVLAFHALLICPAIDLYTDAACERGSVPRANCETISYSQAQYTRELRPYYIWRAHLRRLLDNRSSIYAQPNQQRRVSTRQFYPSDEPVSVFPAPRY